MVIPRVVYCNIVSNILLPFMFKKEYTCVYIYIYFFFLLKEYTNFCHLTHCAPLIGIGLGQMTCFILWNGGGSGLWKCAESFGAIRPVSFCHKIGPSQTEPSHSHQILLWGSHAEQHLSRHSQQHTTHEK